MCDKISKFIENQFNLKCHFINKIFFNILRHSQKRLQQLYKFTNFRLFCNIFYGRFASRELLKKLRLIFPKVSCLCNVRPYLQEVRLYSMSYVVTEISARWHRLFQLAIFCFNFFSDCWTVILLKMIIVNNKT